MKISEGISILMAERTFERTPRIKKVEKSFPRPLNEYAKECVNSVIEDEKNYENDLTQCLGCGFVISVLLTSEGCPNCGVQDLSLNIEE